eukprot:TRINITY_DN212_c0_g1_i4.p2 TRINITY_DN212_c0_g1~~TRINITY_DN212_c0_g1_i4.p2  ORF type:complete len:138 (+),score=34.16 TRINITY_DN212_c0_g1_i4:116-529(+)
MTDIDAIAKQFQELRAIKGHWSGGEQNPDTDNYNGKKHQLMKQLKEHYGKPGTAGVEIIKALGKPDDVRPNLYHEGHFVPLAPGPVIPAGAGNAPHSAQGSTYYLIYHWRAQHDYLWFKVNASTELVESSNWYHALE